MSFKMLSFDKTIGLLEESPARAKADHVLPQVKLALVTSFPPSKGDLNEYGFHLARTLQHNARISLTILADGPSLQPEIPGFNVRRCWRFNSIFNLVRVLRAILKTRP